MKQPYGKQIAEEKYEGLFSLYKKKENSSYGCSGYTD
jgi:hypothetical protein